VLYRKKAGGQGCAVGRSEVKTLDPVDVVVEFALAGGAAVLAGVLLLGGRRGGTVAVRGRAVRHPAIWAVALLLVALVLVLRVAIEMVPAGWQPAVIAATVVVAFAGLAISTLAIARSRRP
jgi:hypothetical protein